MLWWIAAATLLCLALYKLPAISEHALTMWATAVADPASNVRGGDFSNIW